MRKYIYITAFLLFFAGCNQTDLTPAYIVIDEEVLVNCIDISTFNEETVIQQPIYDSYQLEALKSQRFSAIWVTINNNDERGVWELPCKIPILASGPVTLKFSPAYHKNGMSTILPGYRMVSSLEKQIIVEKEKEIRFTKDDLKFKYDPRVFFPLLEIFEQSTRFSQREEGIGANIVLDNKDGRSVGLVELNNSLSHFDIMTDHLRLAYKGENFTLLELEYKIEYTASATPSILPEFAVEVRYTNTYNYPVHAPLVNFRYNKNKEWRTVYVDLSKVIGEGSLGGILSDLKICLTASMPENETYSNIKFFFDNIKITTY